MSLTWEQHQKNIFGGESGGDYDALFGYQNRPNGAFAGIKVSQMPVGDVIKFTSPSGKYGQYVKGQVGRVATPVGAYQVVGTTLRDAVKALGIDPNQKFDKATQDKIGQYILKTQGTGAWEGYGKGGASMQNKPAQSNAQGFLGGLLGGQGIGGALGLSDDMRDKLRMGILAGSDPRAFAQQIQAAQQSITARRQERQKQAGRNATADYLDSIGQGDLAKLLRAGGINASTAFGAIPKADKSYQYQSLAADLLRTGVAKTEAEALQMALANTKAGTTVNVGPQGEKLPPPPSGYTYRYNKDQTVMMNDEGVPMVVPLSGGPKDTTTVDEAKAQSKATMTGTILQEAQKARELISPYSTGFGSLLSSLPTTDARQLELHVRSLKAQATIETLNAMRQQSPTGGALGNVTNAENAMLAAKAGALDPASGADAFAQQLDDYEETLLKIVHGNDAGAKIFSQSRQAQPSSDTQATDDDLLKKYGGG